jgi:1-acyl-sn-glycerol-3-phosphate acyltransferase
VTPTRPRYRFAQVTLSALAHVFFGFRYEGRENVPLDGPCLFAANHKSYLDPPLLGAAAPREISYFAKKELFRIPLFGPMIRGYGAIPIDRAGFDRQGIEQALEVLERGGALLVFPEGTRIRRSGFGEPKVGIGLLALRSGAPVVPVHLASTWEPRRRGLRRIPVRVRFGAPLRFERTASGPVARARYHEVALIVMAAIAALSEPK